VKLTIHLLILPKLKGLVCRNSVKYLVYLQETNHMSKIKPERLTPFKNTEAVYFSDYINYTHTMCDKNAHIRSVTEGGIYNYHWDLNLSCGMGNSDITIFPFTVRTVCSCGYDGSSCSLL